MVRFKKILFRGDFLTFRDITRAIYRCRVELNLLNQLEFIEPVSGLFHVQMSILKLLLNAMRGSEGDKISLTRFQVFLKRKGAEKNTKDFHTCNDFFQIVVTAFVVTLCMHHSSYTWRSDFSRWLSRND